MPGSKVIVTLRVMGFHRWPDAAEAAPEVAYLANEHRHVFHLRVEWPVGHDDREIEFHIAQGWVRNALSVLWPSETSGISFGAMSCEAIARALAGALPVKPVAIECWEDGENGARVEF